MPLRNATDAVQNISENGNSGRHWQNGNSYEIIVCTNLSKDVHYHAKLPETQLKR